MKSLLLLLFTTSACYAQDNRIQVKPIEFINDTLVKPVEFMIRNHTNYVKGQAVILAFRPAADGSDRKNERYRILWYIDPQKNQVSRDQVISIVK